MLPHNSTQSHSENKCSRTSQKMPRKMVAIDWEIVGTRPKGHVSSLAWCNIVSYHGDKLYDEYILPLPPPISRLLDQIEGHLEVVHDECFEPNLKDTHREDSGGMPPTTLKPFNTSTPSVWPTTPSISAPSPTRRLTAWRMSSCLWNVSPRSFRTRTCRLGKSGHSSVEDAQATMELYSLAEVKWEQHLAHNPPKD